VEEVGRKLLATAAAAAAAAALVAADIKHLAATM